MSYEIVKVPIIDSTTLKRHDAILSSSLTPCVHSASSINRLTPEDVMDYVVLHELCHLTIKDHSHHYWDILHKYMPNYYDNVEWLRVNGRALL